MWAVFLIEALEKEAIENGLHAIFAFTYVAEFFQQARFPCGRTRRASPQGLERLPACPKFQCCDEIAMLKALSPDPVPA